MLTSRRIDDVPARLSNQALDELHATYAATRDQRLRARLVESYLPFAYRAASRFRDRGERLDDLRQVAVTALVVALDRYDPGRGVRFTTYGERCITGELKRHFRDHGWAMRVGRSAQERYLELRAAVEALHHELGRSPTIPDIAEFLGISEEDVLTSMEIGDVRHAASLDAPLPGREREANTGVDVGAVDPGFDEVERRVLRTQILDDLLVRLAHRDRELVRLYYLEGRSQMEVARIIGASQVSVSRQLARILGRLRAMAKPPATV